MPENTPENTLEDKWKWFISLGVVWMILGIIAIAAPTATGLALGTIIGWLFLVGGVATLIGVFTRRDSSHPKLRAILSIIYLGAGIFLINKPESAAVTLTFFLGWVILIESGAKIVWSLYLRPLEGWGWLLISGIVSAILGFFIFKHWPSDAPWMVGLLIGLNLLLTGWALIMIGVSGKRQSQG